jgi:glutathione synthase/RimK-type ligase-like ATP-grasp enzyme/ribosomal protein S18 acetylase RimI-like enzyme
MSIIIRKSVQGDIVLLSRIEKEAFPDFQQSSLRSLRTSLNSQHQEVWIAEKRIDHKQKAQAAACIILHIHKRSIRLFSLGVLPQMQGQGIGNKLITHALSQAIARNCERVVLEALETNTQLISWYQSIGFVVGRRLENYYAPGKNAVRMEFSISRRKSYDSVSNIIVVDSTRDWKYKIEAVRVVSAKSYISDNEFQTNRNLRVFNLCNSYRYQSMGYYVSLLASAREHRAIPSVATIRDFKNLSVIRSIATDIEELIQTSLAKISDNKLLLDIYFGHTPETAYKQIGYKLYQLFETPLLRVVFAKTDKWIITRVMPLNLSVLNNQSNVEIEKLANAYFSKKRFIKPRLKHYRYDLAILVNPHEAHPPSCPVAIKKFKEAANKIGFYVDFITKNDYEDICEYDALFIRETTSVNDHTYQFSRRAYAEGLVVIDDPWSILRCANKIYLNERMRQNKIATPLTQMIAKGRFNKSQAEKFQYPLVLKQPDSAFSLGVTKVNTPDEMCENLKKLFRTSDMVIAQEFLYSDYDWRIGVFDNKPLFACKYYMAKNHWQIYNWQASKEDGVGDSETLRVEDVPQTVMKVALKAASLMGDGLYGVDLKMVDGKVYVIEVNDNPNIDFGIEDAVLHDEMYLHIMTVIMQRIELLRNTSRLVSIDPD